MPLTRGEPLPARSPTIERVRAPHWGQSNHSPVGGTSTSEPQLGQSAFTGRTMPSTPNKPTAWHGLPATFTRPSLWAL